MKCSIVGLGTALPPDKVSQDDALEMSTDVICQDDRQQRFMRMLFRKSGVDTRHTVIPWQYGYKWKEESLAEAFAEADTLETVEGPSTGDRMQLYAQHAGPLAQQAAAMAIDDANLNPSEITHVVTVSCTGFDSPGVDVQLIRKLGLPKTAQRVHVGFMGCHGAINGLRTARGLVASDPSAVVLLCCYELCSLHYRMSWDDEGVVGNALFADGSAAVVLRNQQPNDRAALCDTASCLIEDSEDEMSWKIGDHGFEMRLTGRVPELIESHLERWLSQWLSTHNIEASKVANWIVHPGGPRIIDAVQSALKLQDSDLQISREILKSRGNMSSPTVLFILKQLLEDRRAGPTVMLAFGPGLVAEAVLLSV